MHQGLPPHPPAAHHCSTQNTYRSALLLQSTSPPFDTGSHCFLPMLPLSEQDQGVWRSNLHPPHPSSGCPVSLSTQEECSTSKALWICSLYCRLGWPNSAPPPCWERRYLVKTVPWAAEGPGHSPCPAQAHLRHQETLSTKMSDCCDFFV